MLGAPFQASSLLKEGTKHLTGLEEAILRNIDACKQLSQVTRTSLGPNGMNKMVINHLGRLFVTSDAATIIKELEVQHPAAKMLVMASQMQEQEVGDGTNLVIVLGGEMLQQADSLIRMGLHPSDIVAGYQRAGKKTLELLEGLATLKCEDVRDVKQVTRALRAIISAKQNGWEEVLAPLVAQACVQVLPKNPNNFVTENVRVAKTLGGGITDTKVIKGFVLLKSPEGTIHRVEKAKIAVLATGIESSKTEAKGTVILDTADRLIEFSKGEEKIIEETIKAVAEAGAKVIVSGGNISDIALHFIERYGLLAVKVASKFDLRRLCKATGATPLVRLGAPTAEELGYADFVGIEEFGEQKVTVFRQDSEDSGLSTIIIRAATQNLLDDFERCIDDAVNAYKGLIRDSRLVPGGGATEIELARQLQTFGDSAPGLDQYAIKKYAEAFEVVPRTLADNAGINSIDIISSLYAAHQGGKTTDGIDIDEGVVKNMVEAEILDPYITKYWAIKFATDVVVTILRVDQIIMSRPAGGPKVPNQGARDTD